MRRNLTLSASKDLVLLCMSDLRAGKLYPHTQKEHFLGYISESKGFCIYWPEKWTISIEQNVIFNSDDLLTENNSVIIQDDVTIEGEKGKVIQNKPKDKILKTCQRGPFLAYTSPM